jgi:hypothetical protein
MYLRFVEVMALTWMQTVLTFVQVLGREAILLRALRNRVMKNMRHVILLTLMTFATAIVAPSHCVGSHGGAGPHTCCNASDCVCPAPSSAQKQPLPDLRCGLGVYASALVNGGKAYGSTLLTSSPLAYPYKADQHSTPPSAITRVLQCHFSDRVIPLPPSVEQFSVSKLVAQQYSRSQPSENALFQSW